MWPFKCCLFIPPAPFWGIHKSGVNQQSRAFSSKAKTSVAFSTRGFPGILKKNKRKITRITLRDQPTHIAGWKMGPFDCSRCISLLKMGLFQPAILVYQRFFAAFLQFGEFFSTSKIGQRLEQTSMFRREMF